MMLRVSSWWWPLFLGTVTASLLLLVNRSAQLEVGVVGALLVGAAVAFRERKLWSLCLTDPLTGLPNRRGFQRRFDQELSRVRRQGESMALVLVDCDRFKQINDQHGHAAGDWALKELARVLSAGVRRCDVVARWGGDEFVVLLPDVDEAEVQRVAARVGQVLRPTAPPRVSFTVSFGCVVRDPCQARTVRLSAMLSAADRALYLAKQRGGGQLAAWSDPCLDHALSLLDLDQHTPPIRAG